MPYSKNAPSYDALQWTGENIQEMIDFANTWHSCFPEETATHDTENNRIITCRGYVLDVGDWLITPGYWHPLGNREGHAEVVTNEVFEVKYSLL